MTCEIGDDLQLHGGIIKNQKRFSRQNPVSWSSPGIISLLYTEPYPDDGLMTLFLWAKCSDWLAHARLFVFNVY